MYYIDVSFNDQKFCLLDDGNSSLVSIQRNITSKFFMPDILGSWKTCKDEPVDAGQLPIRTLKDLGLTSLKFEDSKNKFTMFLDLYDDIVKPFSAVKLDDSEEDTSPEALRIKYAQDIEGNQSTFCNNMNVAASNFSSYVRKGKQRYGPRNALSDFDRYSPITKKYVLNNDAQRRDPNLKDRYLNSNRVAELFERRLIQLQHLFQEITGYGKSIGKLSWVDVFVKVSDRMNDIENHLYHDIHSGYVRIVTSKSDGKLASCHYMQVMRENQLDMPITSTIGGVIKLDNTYYWP